jgi:Uma2 family endonuclease
MNAVKLLPYYTYEDYCNWEGRWELIDGIPFAMSPAPNMRHQWLAANIMSEFRIAIKRSGCSHCKVYNFIDIKIEENTVVQPDCSIICKSTKENFLDFPASLVVEILSAATALKDRHTKFSLYQNFGIKYYLIVDPEKEDAEIYLLQDTKYILQKFSPGTPFTFMLTDNCKIRIVMKNIWE